MSGGGCLPTDSRFWHLSRCNSSGWTSLLFFYTVRVCFRGCHHALDWLAGHREQWACSVCRSISYRVCYYILVWSYCHVWKRLLWGDRKITLAAYSWDDRSLIWICSGWLEGKLDLIVHGCILLLLRKSHDMELLIGRFRVSIHDLPLIPRRIDANMTGVTLSPPSSSRILRHFKWDPGGFIVLYCCIIVLLYCCIVVLLYCCIVVLLYCFDRCPPTPSALHSVKSGPRRRTVPPICFCEYPIPMPTVAGNAGWLRQSGSANDLLDDP